MVIATRAGPTVGPRKLTQWDLIANGISDAWDGTFGDALDDAYAKVDAALAEGRISLGRATDLRAAIQSAFENNDTDTVQAIGDQAFQEGREDQVNPDRPSYDPAAVAEKAVGDVVQPVADVIGGAVAGAGRAVASSTPWFVWVGLALVAVVVARDVARAA